MRTILGDITLVGRPRRMLPRFPPSTLRLCGEPVSFVRDNFTERCRRVVPKFLVLSGFSQTWTHRKEVAAPPDNFLSDRGVGLDVIVGEPRIDLTTISQHHGRLTSADKSGGKQQSQRETDSEQVRFRRSHRIKRPRPFEAFIGQRRRGYCLP